METKKLGAFIILLIGVVVSIALLVPTADRVQEMTQKLNMDNDSVDLGAGGYGGAKNASQINLSYEHDLTKAPTGWRRTSCPISNVVVGNESQNYTVTTDYTVNSSHGFIKFLNTSVVFFGTNATHADYDYCTTGYITNSAARTVTRLILIFAGLAILAFAIYHGIKEWL